MKNKKGFSLVELLAVITILSIILLIAMPVVSNIIEKTEREAIGKSAENYFKAVNIALAAAEMDGIVEDGIYRVDKNGNISFGGKTIVVETNGNIPNKGGIVKVQYGQVVKEGSKLVIKDHEVEFNNDSGKLDVGKVVMLSDVCKYKGTNASKKYALGAEYECDPGDGVLRTFYVLEDGDTTQLTKTDGSIHYAGNKVGTANGREISLIMSENIGTSPYITEEKYWEMCGSNCSDSGSVDSAIGPVTADRYLKEETTDKGWKTEVYLPTYDQIYMVNKSTSLFASPWLTDNATDTGYWVSTSLGMTGFPSDVYMVITADEINILGSGFQMVFSSVGIRPVITVAKD